MDSDTWLNLLLFLVLIAVSAFFSGSESAYFSLTELDLAALRQRDKRSAACRRILSMMERPRRLLMAILVGNTVVNVAAATLATLLIHRYWPHGMAAFVIEVVGVTLLLLVFSEVTPKIVAVKQPLQFARFVSLPLEAVTWLLLPLTWMLEKLTDGFSKVTGVESELPFRNEEELKAMLEVSQENGELDANERDMIHSIFEFRETVVREVMVPRTDVVQVEKDTSIDDVLTLVKEMGHSRIPVYHEKVDNIIGILHVKDLLPYMSGGRNVPSLEKLVRKAFYVPESKMIDELLREFQQERNHMAIVVDEYGGTAGLVTLEDILEEIVGEIRDEYDEEIPLIDVLNESRWRVDGKISISELNEELDFNLPEDDEYDSLGGFILSQLGHIPEPGEEALYADLRLSVESVESQRIQLVLIERHDSLPPASDQGNAP